MLGSFFKKNIFPKGSQKKIGNKFCLGCISTRFGGFKGNILSYITLSAILNTLCEINLHIYANVMLVNFFFLKHCELLWR